MNLILQERDSCLTLNAVFKAERTMLSVLGLSLPVTHFGQVGPILQHKMVFIENEDVLPHLNIPHDHYKKVMGYMIELRYYIIIIVDRKIQSPSPLFILHSHTYFSLSLSL